MAKRKTNPLAQAIVLFNQLDERDKQTMADYVKSQTAKPRKKTVKSEKPLLQDASKVG